MLYDNPPLEEAVQSAPAQAAPRIGSRVMMIRLLQEERGDEPCFRTDKRLTCRREECQWRQECRRLVAAWKR
jgi:hypothetical protein